MSDHPHTQARSDNRNLINTVQTTRVHDVTSLPPNARNSLFHLKGNQALNINATYRYHDVQPTGSTPTTMASSQKVEFLVPNYLHVVDKMNYYFTLTNGHGSTSWESDLPFEYSLRYVEIKQGGQLIQTIYPDDLYVRHTIILNPDELINQEVNNALDPTSRQGDNTVSTIAAAASATLNVQIDNVVTLCNLLVSALQPVSVIIHYQDIANISNSAVNSSIAVSGQKLRVREQFYSDPDVNRMMSNYRQGVDHRFCACIIETYTTTLAANTINKRTLEAYNGELSPLQVVMVRDLSDIDANTDACVAVSTIHRENASGNNLDNGITWTDADLRTHIYPQFFPNNQSQTSGNKYVYTLVSSMDPVRALKEGINSGYTVLNPKTQLCINPGGSALSSHTIDYLCYIYKHVRVNGDGKIMMM
jgi:hypothetical protein